MSRTKPLCKFKPVSASASLPHCKLPGHGNLSLSTRRLAKGCLPMHRIELIGYLTCARLGQTLTNSSLVCNSRVLAPNPARLQGIACNELANSTLLSSQCLNRLCLRDRDKQRSSF